MIYKNAFTLIELLIVLWIVSMLSLIIAPPVVKQLEAYNVNQFLKVLKSDIEFIQQHAISGENYKISFQDNKYLIIKSAQTVKSREYPKNMRFTKSYNHYLMFTTKGNVSKPGTVTFTHNNHNISLVFPLGRGRFYFKN